jgi:malonyl-CoA O-methyltransferase
MVHSGAQHDELLKAVVADSFGQRARNYNEYAKVQRTAAEFLVSMVDDQLSGLSGPYLEIGAGTGFLTQPLINQLPAGVFYATDLSEEMLHVCRENLEIPSGMDVVFDIRDAEMPLDHQKYGLIATAMTAQWFEDTRATLKRYAESLKPGGLLIYSYLDETCFPEWKALCAESGVPFTGNILPASAPLNIDTDHFCWESTTNEFFSETYPSPADFFRNLKRIGAGTQKNGNKNSVGAVLSLNEHWMKKGLESFKITYGITFGAIRRKKS